MGRAKTKFLPRDGALPTRKVPPHMTRVGERMELERFRRENFGEPEVGPPAPPADADDSDD